ncbi:MAG: hypothetical protein RR623_09590 [Bacilli bacterium]
MKKILIIYISIIIASNPISALAEQSNNNYAFENSQITRVIIQKEVSVNRTFGIGEIAPGTLAYNEVDYTGTSWSGSLTKGRVVWIDHLFVCYEYKGTVFAQS